MRGSYSPNFLFKTMFQPSLMFNVPFSELALSKYDKERDSFPTHLGMDLSAERADCKAKTEWPKVGVCFEDGATCTLANFSNLD